MALGESCVFELSTTHLETSTLFNFQRAKSVANYHTIICTYCFMFFNIKHSIHEKDENGDDRDRTCNLRLAKPALSQLSYIPGQNQSQISDLKSQID